MSWSALNEKMLANCSLISLRQTVVLMDVFAGALIVVVIMNILLLFYILGAGRSSLVCVAYVAFLTRGPSSDSSNQMSPCDRWKRSFASVK